MTKIKLKKLDFSQNSNLIELSFIFNLRRFVTLINYENV